MTTVMYISRTDTVTYMTDCRSCRKRLTVENIGVGAWANFIHGGLIQDAMPDVSASDREIILSQICPECYSKISQEE